MLYRTASVYPQGTRSNATIPHVVSYDWRPLLFRKDGTSQETATSQSASEGKAKNEVIPGRFCRVSCFGNVFCSLKYMSNSLIGATSKWTLCQYTHDISNCAVTKPKDANCNAMLKQCLHFSSNATHYCQPMGLTGRDSQCFDLVCTFS